MKLTKEDKLYLQILGHPEDEIRQIELAAGKTTYTALGENKRLSRDEAICRLGRTVWLSGLSRSAFHRTAVRETGSFGQILIDSTKFFK